MHAGLVPFEAQESVKHVFESLAPVVSMSPDVLLTTVDKSVPTAAGLAGAVLCCLSLSQVSSPTHSSWVGSCHGPLAWHGWHCFGLHMRQLECAASGTHMSRRVLRGCSLQQCLGGAPLLPSAAAFAPVMSCICPCHDPYSLVPGSQCHLQQVQQDIIQPHARNLLLLHQHPCSEVSR